MNLWPFRRKLSPRPPPLLFITHAKAGSTWIDHVLRALYRKQVAPRAYGLPERFELDRFPVYSALFMTQEEFLRHEELRGVPRFVVWRDLRDTLVSLYFSVRDVHELDPGGYIAARREALQSRNQEEGLAYMMDALEPTVEIQQSWAQTEAPIYRYEALLGDDVRQFSDLLIRRLGHPLGEEQVRVAVEANRFENVFGRKIGQADATSHGRQGAPGDWRNHFTPALRRHFHERFGEVMRLTGYEADGGWVTAT